MNHRRRCRTAGMVAALALVMSAAGCVKKQPTMDKPPEINPRPQVETDADVRADELGQLSGDFSDLSGRLPGGSPEEHRQLMQQAFAALAQILPILEGPEPDGVFRQQLRIVESSRTQLATGSQTLSPEPTIDTGLRAAQGALDRLGRNSYFEQSKLGQALDQLSARVNELDAARGAMHQGVVAEVVGLMSQAIGGMSDVLGQRVEQQSTTRPAAPAGAAAPGGSGAGGPGNDTPAQ